MCASRLPLPKHLYESGPRGRTLLGADDQPPAVALLHACGDSGFQCAKVCGVQLAVFASVPDISPVAVEILQRQNVTVQVEQLEQASSEASGRNGLRKL